MKFTSIFFSASESILSKDTNNFARTKIYVNHSFHKDTLHVSLVIYKSHADYTNYTEISHANPENL